MAASSHALLGPSSSHQWLNCTPSARLCESVEDKGSNFALEGSCAHALCEQKLWELLGDKDKADEAFREQEKCDRERFYGNEMESCADDYASAVWGKYQEALKTTPDAKIFIERRLDFSAWIPESFGTADAIIIADGTMEVIDYKYGRGVEVSAVSNTQMMIYALGAIREFEDAYRIEHVRMTIIQPRLGNFSEYEMSVDDLSKWAEEELAPKARLAWAGEGEENPGPWCRFCRVKARCAKLANQAISVFLGHENKELITDEEMPEILRLQPAIVAWAKSVEEYALAKAMNGTEFKGFKLVEGRSIRKVSDESALVDRLKEAGYTTGEIYKSPELRSIGDLEKLVGKKDFAAMSQGCIVKPQGKPTLVPESDKRAPMSINSAASDFMNINN